MCFNNKFVILFVFIVGGKYSEKSSSTDKECDVYLSRAEKITGLKLDYGKTIRYYDTRRFFVVGKVLLEIQYSKED